MGQIQVPNFEALGTRVLGVKGAGILTELDPAVVATLATWLSASPDFWLPQGLIPHRGAAGQAAVAAQYSYVELYNPASSGVVVIVTALNTNVFSVIGTRAGSGAALGAFTSNGYSRDLRYTAGLAQAALYKLTNAGILAYDAGYMPAGRWETEYILPPDSSLWLRSGAVNQQLSAGFQWVERNFLPSEL